METVLVCVAPDADYQLYRFFEIQLKSRNWEPYVISVADVGSVEARRVAAVVAHASDWPDERMHEWLAAVRQAVGPRKRLLAILSRPPERYPAETRALWDRALGYGFKMSEAIQIVDDFVAGRG